MNQDNDKKDQTLHTPEGDYSREIRQMWSSYKQKLSDDTNVSEPLPGKSEKAPEDLFEDIILHPKQEPDLILPASARGAGIQDRTRQPVQPEPEAQPEQPEKAALFDTLKDLKVANTEKKRLQKEIRQEQRDRQQAILEQQDREEGPEHRYPIHRRSGKRLGIGLGILYALIIIAVGIAAGLVMWLAASDILAFGRDIEQVEVTIPDSVMSMGETEIKDEDGNTHTERMMLADVSEVAQILEDNGLIRYKKLFEMFCKISHANRKIQPGTYLLSTEYDYHALVSFMRPYSSARVETEIMFPEGYTVAQIFALLEEKGVCTADELYEAAAYHTFDYEFLNDLPMGEKNRLEGFLFPDTYKFYLNDEADNVIEKFLQNFESKFKDEYVERAQELGYTVREVVTIASMIERESTDHKDERETIASVIYNRLHSDYNYLQVDATIWYARSLDGVPEDVPLTRDYDSIYNTDLHPGLPPGPIANPGEAAIRAALYPVDSQYLYYALGKDGYHHFFTNYDDHIRFTNSDEYAYNG